MTLSSILTGISAYLQKVTAKSSLAENADSSTSAEGRKTKEYAENVLQSITSSAGLSTIKEGTMTVDAAKKKVVDWCKSQVGYHEALDGSNKYGADGDWDLKLYGFEASNVAWCDVFVDYVFIHCFGYDCGTEMTYQVPNGYAACKLSADAYKRNGAFYKEPQVGDQIFFYNSGDINHTGVVVSVEGETIQCVEGNYSDSVMLTKYNTKNQWLIAGYGRPDWSVVADEADTSETAEDEQEEITDSEEIDIVHPKNRRTYMHLEYGDGLNLPLAQVRAWQALLQCWGFVLDADGEFGENTANATRQWQQKAKDIGADVEVNGIVDEDDWKEIINIKV